MLSEARRHMEVNGMLSGNVELGGGGQRAGWGCTVGGAAEGGWVACGGHQCARLQCEARREHGAWRRRTEGGVVWHERRWCSGQVGAVAVAPRALTQHFHIIK